MCIQLWRYDYASNAKKAGRKAFQETSDFESKQGIVLKIIEYTCLRSRILKVSAVAS